MPWELLSELRLLLKEQQTEQPPTLTDDYTLEGVKKGSILQISFVGYTTKEVKYTGQSVLKIMLQEDTKTLDEVVVVGLVHKRKST